MNRCCICGKFRPWDWLTAIFTPDTAHTSEDIYYECKEGYGCQMIKDVHTDHCCKIHGCKYGNSDCTVTTGRGKQEYPCESCRDHEHAHRACNDRITKLQTAIKEYLDWGPMTSSDRYLFEEKFREVLIDTADKV